VTPRPPSAAEAQDENGRDWLRIGIFLTALIGGGFVAYYVFPVYVRPVLAAATPWFDVGFGEGPQATRLPLTATGFVGLVIHVVLFFAIIIGLEQVVRSEDKQT
jgi:hypothetical protein